jgi:hypothetical protein
VAVDAFNMIRWKLRDWDGRAVGLLAYTRDPELSAERYRPIYHREE